jgi:hypothetical protein
MADGGRSRLRLRFVLCTQYSIPSTRSAPPATLSVVSYLRPLIRRSSAKLPTAAIFPSAFFPDLQSSKERRSARPVYRPLSTRQTSMSDFPKHIDDKTRILRHPAFYAKSNAPIHLRQKSAITSPAALISRPYGEVFRPQNRICIARTYCNVTTCRDRLNSNMSNTSPRSPQTWRSIPLLDNLHPDRLVPTTIFSGRKRPVKASSWTVTSKPCCSSRLRARGRRKVR